MTYTTRFALCLGVRDPRLLEAAILDIEGLVAWAEASTTLSTDVVSLIPAVWRVGETPASRSWRHNDPYVGIGTALRTFLTKVTESPTLILDIESNVCGMGVSRAFVDTEGVRMTPASRLARMIDDYLVDAPASVKREVWARFPPTARGKTGVPRRHEMNVFPGMYRIEPHRVRGVATAAGDYPISAGRTTSSYPYVGILPGMGAHVKSIRHKTVRETS